MPGIEPPLTNSQLGMVRIWAPPDLPLCLWIATYIRPLQWAQ